MSDKIKEGLALVSSNEALASAFEAGATFHRSVAGILDRAALSGDWKQVAEAARALRDVADVETQTASATRARGGGAP